MQCTGTHSISGIPSAKSQLQGVILADKAKDFLALPTMFELLDARVRIPLCPWV